MDKRHVIVTGGSRGLGATIVENLLAADYVVSTCSRTKTPFIERLEAERRNFFWSPCQVGDDDQVDSFVHAAEEWSGGKGIYGLVNNAGVAQAGILATFPNVESEKVLRVNLLGALQAARAVSRRIILQNRGGRIINISSIIGVRGYNGLAAYSASKAGMDGLTRALARELGRSGVTVNSVAPGYVETDMSVELTPSQLAQIVNRTPLGRLASVQDVANVVLFLLSEAAGFVTGQTILVDGGISS